MSRMLANCNRPTLLCACWLLCPVCMIAARKVSSTPQTASSHSKGLRGMYDMPNQLC